MKDLFRVPKKALQTSQDPATRRYMFQTKRQKCVKLLTAQHSDGQKLYNEHSHGQLENNKEKVDFFKINIFVEFRKKFGNVAVFAI